MKRIDSVRKMSLYRLKNFNSVLMKEDMFLMEKRHIMSDIGSSAEQMSMMERDLYNKRLFDVYTKLGVDWNGMDTANSERIEMPSETMTEHDFKVGTFPIGNDDMGTFGGMLSGLGLPGVIELFPPSRSVDAGMQRSYVFPDWTTSFDNLVDLQGEVRRRTVLSADGRMTALMSVELPLRNPLEDQIVVKSKVDAIDMTMQIARTTSRDIQQSKVGSFYNARTLAVRSIIHGMYGVFVTYEEDVTDHFNAIKIMRETVEYVISQDHTEEYCFKII